MSAAQAELQIEIPDASDLVGITCFAPFKELPAAVAGAIAEIAEMRNYADGETVFALGQFDGGEALLVARGAAKVSRMDVASGAMQVDRFSAGTSFWLAEAIGQADLAQAETISMTADGDLAVFAIEAAALRQLVLQKPSLTKVLMLHFAQRLANGGAQHVAEETTPERRIYAAVMALVERDAVDGLWKVTRMPKHREIAEQAGVEETAAAHAIAKIIQDGVAKREYPGLVISDMAEFSRLAR